MRNLRQVVQGGRDSGLLLERLPPKGQIPKGQEAMRIRAWLAATKDMPAFCEWFGMARARRVMEMSDEEIFAEVRARGLDPHSEAERIRGIIDRASTGDSRE